MEVFAERVPNLLQDARTDRGEHGTWSPISAVVAYGGADVGGRLNPHSTTSNLKLAPEANIRVYSVGGVGFQSDRSIGHGTKGEGREAACRSAAKKG